MCQLPPDSHCARRSQSESGAAAAVGAIRAAAAPKAMVVAANFVPTELVLEIGRASCRERGGVSVVVVALNRKMLSVGKGLTLSTGYVGDRRMEHMRAHVACGWE